MSFMCEYVYIQSSILLHGIDAAIILTLQKEIIGTLSAEMKVFYFDVTEWIDSMLSSPQINPSPTFQSQYYLVILWYSWYLKNMVMMKISLWISLSGFIG